jgi:hypothetical protein
MAKINIADLPQDEGLDRDAMAAVRGGASLLSRFTPGEPVRSIPSDPVRTFIPGEPIPPVDTHLRPFSFTSVRM